MLHSFKPIKIYLSIIISLFLLSLNGCVISEYVEAVKNSDKADPKWDVDITAPVYDKTIVMNDYIDTTRINSCNLNIGGIPQWPVPAGLGLEGPYNLNGNVTITDVDLDSNGTNDLDLYGIYAPNANVSINLSLTDGAATYPINPSDIILTSITIEGVTYTIDYTSTSNNVLVYTINNFLTSTNGYLNLAGDAGSNRNQLNIEQFIISLGTSAIPAYNTGPYTLNIDINFNLGTNISAAGRVVNDVVLLNETNVPIPVNSLPFDKIKDFKLDFIFNSHCPLTINLVSVFKADNTIPNPNISSLSIEHGILTQNTIYNYWYVSDIKNTTNSLRFLDNILNYDDFKMDYSVILPATTDIILLSTSDYLDITINIGGKATVDL